MVVSSYWREFTIKLTTHFLHDLVSLQVGQLVLGSVHQLVVRHKRHHLRQPVLPLPSLDVHANLELPKV